MDAPSNGLRFLSSYLRAGLIEIALLFQWKVFLLIWSDSGNLKLFQFPKLLDFPEGIAKKLPIVSSWGLIGGNCP